MAKIVQQAVLWDTLDLGEIPGLLEVKSFLGTLSQFDATLVQLLEEERGNGRDDYPVRAMWHLVVLGPLLGHARFTAILGELQRNLLLARQLGFRADGVRVALPDKCNVSRFWKNLKKHTPEVDAILDLTVKALKERIPQLGRRVAGDASDIRTHARPRKKVAAITTPTPESIPASPGAAACSAGPAVQAGTAPKEKPCADPEASWSVKTKTDIVNGEKKTRTEATFGYKVNALVDQEVAVVLSCRTTTGSSPDIHQAADIVHHAIELLGKGCIEEAAFDKAYDDEAFILECASQGIAAVIPVRDVPDDLEKLPASDREEALAKGDNIAVDRYTGGVVCYDNSGPTPVRREMVYGGFEKERETHKFRCPAAAQDIECPFRARCGGGHFGKIGRQVRIPMSADPRRFAPIYPRSKRWARAYKGRTAVERLFSVVKGTYHLEEHALRGRAAIHLRVLLAAITLNVRTFSRAQIVHGDLGPAGAGNQTGITRPEATLAAPTGT